jgi:hypothetical protein
LLLPAGLIALRLTALLLATVLRTLLARLMLLTTPLLAVLFLVELDRLAALGVFVLLFVIGHVVALLFPARAPRAGVL